MTRRALGGFLAINIIVSIVVAFLIIFVWSETNENDPIVVTRPVVIDAGGNSNDGNDSTIGAVPNEAYEQTIASLNTDRTAQAREIATLEIVAATAGVVIETDIPVTEPAIDTGGIPTIDPTILEAVTLPAGSGPSINSGGAGTATPDDGCQRYFVQEGDLCGSIAENFNVNVDDLINLNNLDCLALQIDQEIRIPGPSCQSPPTVTPTPTITRTPFRFGTFSITNTPVPTSTTSEIEIVQVLQAGDVTAEQVNIRNNGVDVIEMEGWTLTDSDGNTFTFPDLRMQPSQVIRVFSRVGQNTPAALYWNQTEAMWQIGETATLADGSGTPQSVYTVPDPETIEFGENDG